MDKLEEIRHLVLAAISKVWELSNASLDSEQRQKVEGLLKDAKDTSRRIDELAELNASDGKLDKAAVDSALDRIIATMKSVNQELDQLLAKARIR